MASPSEMVIRPSRAMLLPGLYIVVGIVLLASSDGRSDRAGGVIFLLTGGFFVVAWLVNSITITPERVVVRSGVVTRSYLSDQILEAHPVSGHWLAGGGIYVGDERVKLPFLVRLGLLQDLIRQVRGGPVAEPHRERWYHGRERGMLW